MWSEAEFFIYRVMCFGGFNRFFKYVNKTTILLTCFSNMFITMNYLELAKEQFYTLKEETLDEDRASDNEDEIKKELEILKRTYKSSNCVFYFGSLNAC